MEPRFTGYTPDAVDKRAVIIYDPKGEHIGDMLMCPGYPGRESMFILGHELA